MKAQATQIPNSRLLPRHGSKRGSVRPGYAATLALVGLLHAPTLAFAQAAKATPEAKSNAPDASTPAASEAAKAEHREKARAAYFAGKSAYSAGNFAEAEIQFTLANSLISAIQAQYWLARSLHEQGKSAQALTALGQILVHPNRGKLRTEQLKDAAARHAQLKSAPADVLLNTDPSGATVTVNGQVVATPTPTALRLGPGKHEVTVELEGYTTQRFLLNAEPGAKVSPTVKMVAAPTRGLAAPPPLPGPVATGAATSGLSAPAAILPTSGDTYSQQSQSMVPAIVTLGIAGASAVVGTIFGLKALSEKKDFNDSPSTGAADDTERNALIADMAFGVTLTLGITGAVLLLTRESDSSLASSDGETDSANLQILPYATPNSAGAAALFSF